jgi:tetratricopeptide (TPR) repeat protein
MSPEQATGMHEVDGRSDVYSLGCVLYEMLTGQLPFTASNARALMARHFMDEVPSIQTVRPSVPAHLERAVRRALAKVPADRFASAADFGAALAGVDVDLPAIPGNGARWTRLSGRMRIAAGVAAVGLLSAALIALPAVRRALSPATRLSRDVLAVFPFSAPATGAVSGLGRGLFYVLSQDLGGVGTLRTVDASTLLAALPPGARSDLTPDEARAIAARLGAGRFILGSVIELGENVRMTAVMYDDAGRADTTVSVDGPKEDESRLVTELEGRLLAAASGLQGSLLTNRPAANNAALRAYIDGLQWSAAAHLAESVPRFQAAVAADSLFAPAWFQLAFDAVFAGMNDSLSRVALHRASDLGRQLTERHRALLEAELAFDSGAVYRSLELAQKLTRRYPDESHSWGHIGLLRLQNNAMFGAPTTDAREALDHALALQPTDAASALLRISVELSARNRGAYDSLVRRFASLVTKHTFRWSVLAAGAFLHESRDEQDRVLGDAQLQDDDVVEAAVMNIAMVDLDGAIRMARVLTDRSRPRIARVAGLTMIAHLQAGVGHLRASDSALVALDSINPAEAIVHRAWFALLPDRMPARDSLERLRSSLEHWDAAHVSEPHEVHRLFDDHRDVWRHLRLYLLGLVDARLGDYPVAMQRAEALEKLPSSFAAGSLPHDLARGVRAEVFRAQGDTAQALAQFDWESVHVRFPKPFFSPFFSRARERFLNVLLLDLSGNANAARWLEASATNQWVHDVAERAPFLIRHARAMERLGRRADARASYQRAIAIWHNCDPELRPLRAEAEAALKRLGS